MLRWRELQRGVFASCILALNALTATSCGNIALPPPPTPGPGLVKTLTDHTLWVDRVAWSPDGKLIASGSSDGKVRIWDVSSGQTIHINDFGPFSMRSVGWSADSKYLAVGLAAMSDTLQIWDVANWQPTYKTTPRGQVYQAEWSPDGQSIAVALGFIGLQENALQDGVDVYDIASGQVTASLVYSDVVTMLAWSPDSKYITFPSFSETGPSELLVWDVSKGSGQGQTTSSSNYTSVITEPAGQNGAVGIGNSAWSPDGKMLAYDFGQVGAKVRDTSTWQPVTTLNYPGGVGVLAWSPDGTRIAATTSEQSVIVWDVASGQQVDLFTHPDLVATLSWSPDSKQLVTGCADHNVYIWAVK